MILELFAGKVPTPVSHRIPREDSCSSKQPLSVGLWETAGKGPRFPRGSVRMAKTISLIFQLSGQAGDGDQEFLCLPPPAGSGEGHSGQYFTVLTDKLAPTDMQMLCLSQNWNSDYIRSF